MKNIEPTTKSGNFSNAVYSVSKRTIITFVVLTITSVVVARQLEPTNYGLWSLLLMVPTYALIVGRLQVDTASVHFIRSGSYTAEQLSFSLLCINVIVLLILGLISWLSQDIFFSTILSSFSGKKALVYLVCSTIPFEFISVSYSYLFLATNDIKKYNRQELISNLTGPILGGISLIIFEPEIEYLVISLIVGKIISLIHGIFSFHLKTSLTFQLNIVLLKNLLWFGVKIYLSTVLSYISIYISGLFVATLLTPAQIAFHQISLSRVMLLGKIPQGIGIILYPQISSNKDDLKNSANFASRTFRTTLLIMLICGSSAALAIYPMIYILYGEAYMDSCLPFLILLPGVVLNESADTLNAYFMGINRSWFLSIFVGSSLIPQLILLVWLIQTWGIIGAAVATSVTLWISSFIKMMTFIKITETNISEMLIIQKNDVRYIVNFINSKAKKILS